jgi:hypothetical protein
MTTQEIRKFIQDCRTFSRLLAQRHKVPEVCTCPNHTVTPSDMCPPCQAEYVAILDEQAQLDEVQQQYEAVVDR